jgi:hypothetical protein
MAEKVPVPDHIGRLRAYLAQMVGFAERGQIPDQKWIDVAKAEIEKDADYDAFIRGDRDA